MMAHVMPDPDGSKSCSEQIAKLYFKANKEKIVELHGYNGILSRREELVELIEKMKNEKETIDQKISDCLVFVQFFTPGQQETESREAGDL